jgi:hypothetical protein
MKLHPPLLDQGSRDGDEDWFLNVFGFTPEPDFTRTGFFKQSVQSISYKVDNKNDTYGKWQDV